MNSTLNDAGERLTEALQPAKLKSVGGGRIQRMLITSASSVAAVAIALGICAVILLITDKNPWEAYKKLFGAVTEKKVQQDTLNRAAPIMVSAAAVAIGFKMNLFNIGLEGQMRVALLATAVIGASVSLPAPLHVVFCLLVAMVFGAAYAGIAAYLKVKRGVNEVIATIMLNYIALSLVGWAFDDFFRDESNTQGVLVKSKELPTSAWLPRLWGSASSAFVLSVIVLFAFWVLVWKTKFGFRLRASGGNPGAARVTGVNPSRMIAISLLISGAIAGLTGMKALMGETPHAYQNGLGDGQGFNGISVALLGRSHPVGIFFSGLLFGFLSVASGKLQLEDIPREIVVIMQGIIVLAVVIINGAVKRWDERRIQRKAAAELERLEVAATA